jgi:hypothetical protein
MAALGVSLVFFAIGMSVRDAVSDLWIRAALAGTSAGGAYVIFNLVSRQTHDSASR